MAIVIQEGLMKKKADQVIIAMDSLDFQDIHCVIYSCDLKVLPCYS